jgi:hypothetical protein
MGFAGVALLPINRPNLQGFMGSMAYAGTVYWTAQLGDKVGYDWRMSQIEKAGNEAGQGGGAAEAA